MEIVILELRFALQGPAGRVLQHPLPILMVYGNIVFH